MLNNLKKLRKNKKISQQKLAEIILVTQQSINKYENHDVEPSIDTLIKIADYFEVSVDYLIGRTDIKEMASTINMNNLNPSEIKIINKFRKLKNNQKESIENLMDSYE